MCGRFVDFRRVEELREYFPIDVCSVGTTENFNVAPTDEILAIIRHHEQNHLEKLNWGLVPYWAKDKTIGSRLINARSESVATKPSFRDAFRKRRCLILADGFYEWKKDKGKKQPMFLTLPDGQPFAFAGLWDTWGKQDPYRSCTILTMESSASARPIHNRMPVILKPEAFDPWLDPDNQDPKILQNILQHQVHTELAVTPVSQQVNSVRNKSRDNIRSVG